MTQFCPNCGHVMETVFCECPTISSMDGIIHQGGNHIHTACSKPFRPGQYEKIEAALREWYKENDQ